MIVVSRQPRHISRQHLQQGATIIEYTLLIVLLSVAATLAMGTVASSLNERYTSVASRLGS